MHGRGKIDQWREIRERNADDEKFSACSMTFLVIDLKIAYEN